MRAILDDAVEHGIIPGNPLGNWRMTFTFEGIDAVLVDYQDYH